MKDFTDKTTDELREAVTRLRHPGGKEKRLAMLAEIVRREAGPFNEPIVVEEVGHIILEPTDDEIT